MIQPMKLKTTWHHSQQVFSQQQNFHPIFFLLNFEKNYATVIRTPEPVPVLPPQIYDGNDDVGFQVAMRNFLLKVEKTVGFFCGLEMHVHESVLVEKATTTETNNPLQIQPKKEDERKNYRVFIHTGTSKDLIPTKSKKNNKKNNGDNENVSFGLRQVYKLSTIGEAESLYQHLYDFYSVKKNYRPYHIISSKIGSNLLPLSAYISNTATSILPPTIQSLVNLVAFSFLDFYSLYSLLSPFLHLPKTIPFIFLASSFLDISCTSSTPF